MKHNNIVVALFASDVAPYAGAWIETNLVSICLSNPFKSLPTRERGLKHTVVYFIENRKVAPYAGAWIETAKNNKIRLLHISRSLRGSVD